MTGKGARGAGKAAPTEGWVTVEGADLFYRAEGAGEPVLLIAGFTCDLTIWDAVVPFLCDRFLVIRFDNRGIGKSRSSPKNRGDLNGLTITGMADDSAALLGSLGIERAHIVGHSMGGQIAQELALRARSRVATLAHLSCWARPDARFDWLIRLFGAWPRSLVRKTMRAFCCRGCSPTTPTTRRQRRWNPPSNNGSATRTGLRRKSCRHRARLSCQMTRRASSTLSRFRRWWPSPRATR
jgi:pimeloyl-ACP methyl ester carboxylesterase